MRGKRCARFCELFYELHFISREEFGVVFREIQFFCHVVSHFLAVTSEHDGFVDAKGLQLRNGLSTVRLDLVVDDDMTCILTIDGHVDDGADMMAVVPLGADTVHHLRVTHADNLVPYPCTDTVTSNFLDIADLATIGSLIRKGITQGSANGMGREMLDMGSEME